jgi:hypothetical protein
MLTMSLVGDSGFFGSLGAVAKKAPTKGMAVEARRGAGHFKKVLPKGATKGPAREAKKGLAHFNTAVKAKTKAKTAIKAAVVAKKIAASIPKVPVDKAVAKRLQAALATLGRVAKSASLKAVKVDGALGAKTAAAVNLTFTKHIGPGQAPAQLRTGKLTLDQIKFSAAGIATLIENEIRRRGGVPASAATVAKSQPKAKGSAIAKANKALAAKQKAQLAANKKAAALAKRNLLKTQAANERARAAQLRKSNPTAAAQLDALATQHEGMIASVETEATTAAADESAAASEAEVAATQAEEIATTAAQTATQAATQAVTQAATAAVTSMVPGMDPGAAPPAMGPEGPVQASMIPSIESGSFVDRYKWPLLGGIGLLGLLAVVMNKKPGTAIAKRPGLNGYRRRSRGRR